MIVLDSSFLVAFHNTKDVHHDSAASVMERILAGDWGNPVLLEYVFLELVTVLLLRRNLAVATTVADTLLRARELDFVPCADLFLDTYDTFRAQGKLNLSFVDCAIATYARRHPPGFVASFDSALAGLNGVTGISS